MPRPPSSSQESMLHPPISSKEFEEHYDYSLSHTKREILRLFLQGLSDDEIAKKRKCSRGAVNTHITGEKGIAYVFGLRERAFDRCRPDLVELCMRFKPEWVAPEVLEKYGLIPPAKHPDGNPLPPGSSIYMPQGIAEKRAQQVIQNPGALLRIRAPKQTGKTSLVHRILAHTNGLGYRNVTLNLNRVDQENLESSDRFLRYFCHSLSTKLGLEPNLNHWNQNQTGSMPSCSSYIQTQILKPLDVPLVLVLDNIHRLFEYPTTARAFTALLRGWNDDATTQRDLWGKLRQIIVYSTDIYIDFDLNKSPFNVGTPIPLPPLKPEQVQKLAWQYSLRWSSTDEAAALVQFLGGHPYLIQLALYELSQSNLALAEFLAQAPTQTSIYQNHFLDCLESLQSHADLLDVFQQVLEAKEAVRMEAIAAKKLEGLGLIRRNGNQAQVSCPLYEQYFRSELNIK